MSSRPNILMIMADQHHAGCLGHAGHPDVRTPNLDRLAAAGTRFTNCFVQNGVCTPSRASYLTGQYAHTHGVYGNDWMGFPPGLLSLPAHLQHFGYRTALVGKKHLPGWREAGFDYERVCYTADGPTRGLHYYQYLKQHGLHALYDDLGDVERFCLTGGPTVPLEHSLEVWTGRETRRYLADATDDPAPWFMMMSFERPHPPLTVPQGCPFTYDPETLTLPENREEIIASSPFSFDRNVELKWTASCHGEDTLRRALANYYALISLIDDEIGRTLDWLDEEDLAEDTIVIFCADHGDFAGEYGKMAKGWNYDCIHRTPLIWRWPGRIVAAAAKTGLVESIDVFPTLCGLLDVSVPTCVQGHDIGALLTGPADGDRDAVFYEYLNAKTVRTPTHRLSYGWDGTREIGELIDFRDEPLAYANRFDDPDFASVREALLRRLLDWWIATQQPASFSPADQQLPPSRWFANPGRPAVRPS